METNRNYKTYSFKSVGELSSKKEEVIKELEKPPIGIKTPIQLSRNHGIFEMNTELTSQISDNLRNLIQTNHGERLGFYDFGANLRPILFDLGTEEADQIAIQNISKSVGKYMPYVSLDGFQSFVENSDIKAMAKIGIRISYLIPTIDDKLRSIEVMLYMGG